jgi:hypothetical protein
MSAYDQIVELAKAKLERREVPTKEQGVVAVVKERPDLRQRYYAEPRPVAVAKREEVPAKHWSLVKLEEMAQVLRTESREPLTKEQAVVRVMKETAQGRELAAAYREHQREMVRRS